MAIVNTTTLLGHFMLVLGDGYGGCVCCLDKICQIHLYSDGHHNTVGTAVHMKQLGV